MLSDSRIVYYMGPAFNSAHDRGMAAILDPGDHVAFLNPAVLIHYKYIASVIIGIHSFIRHSHGSLQSVKIYHHISGQRYHATNPDQTRPLGSRFSLLQQLFRS